jgi:SWI/SNF-related matrix-associated actin-dependent regulator of chromatin subfamily A3
MSQLQKKLESYPADGGFYAFKIGKTQEYYAVQFSDDKDFGMLNAQTANALDTIVSEPSLYFEAFALARLCHNVLRRAKKLSEATLNLDIYICGSMDIKQTVGSRLSAAKVYLQRIQHNAERYCYDNPHYISFAGIDADVSPQSHFRSTGLIQGSAMHNPREAFAEVCEASQRDSTLKRVEKDVRIKTDLLE